MKYKGIDLPKYQDIISFALSLKGKKQKNFVRAYARTGKYALSNVGYFAGYYDAKKAKKILKIFRTQHPIFGGL